MQYPNPFKKAIPVWPIGREEEMNVTCRFTAAIPPTPGAMLRMTGSTVYRVFVNGVFMAYGPARGPKGWFRVDEIELTDYLTADENIVLIEVAGYNVNNFYTLDQPSFMQAEIYAGNEILAYTAPVGGMPCDVVTERVQKVQKYSFQRAFCEVWRLGKAYTDAFRKMTVGRAVLADCGEKQYLPRRVPFAPLAPLYVTAQIGAGTLSFKDKVENPYRDRSVVEIGGVFKGWTMDELEVTLSEDAGHYVFTPEPMEETPVKPSYEVGAYRYINLRFAQNLTGFIGAHVHCDANTTVIFSYDELYNGQDINVWHHYSPNFIRFDLKPGDYDLLAMEPYTAQYLKITVFDAPVVISDIRLVEYAAPETEDYYDFRCDNEKLNKIWDAAVQTYRQNAVDIYMDCPSRERAGWLCDSFWTSRTEFALTGKSIVEKNFLENFVLPKSFRGLPEGMLPMCYPADQYHGEHIPQWAMWLVMELKEYAKRTGDTELISAFKDKIYGLFAYLDQFRNEDGLLEKIPGWNFIEWSRANALVQDVSYPGNMLYAACLETAAELYDDEKLRADVEKMRETIRRQSFDGKFFTDHAVRGEDGLLHNDGEATEVCQYYAFFLDVATPETYPELWETMIRDFGPYRKLEGNNKYPEVAFANAFMGNYIRLDVMMRYGLMEEVIENIEGYFYNMACITGTLWEHDSTSASVNHGFASHVVVWLRAAKEAGLL